MRILIRELCLLYCIFQLQSIDTNVTLKTFKLKEAVVIYNLHYDIVDLISKNLFLEEKGSQKETIKESYLDNNILVKKLEVSVFAAQGKG